MIIYIFNNYFLDNSGFSKRCQREVDMLSQYQDITIICRQKAGEKNNYQNKYKDIEIKGFNVETKLLETPTRYLSGFYELNRTFHLYKSLFFVLYKCIAEVKKRKEPIKLYVIASPMTLPLFCLFFAMRFSVQSTILEFHDLEPEMAIHMKHLTSRSFVLQIEYLLEKFLCKIYKKIVVTNTIQSRKLSERTSTEKEKIYILPNTIQNMHTISKETSFESLSIKNNDFIVGYISTLSFAYTYEGLVHMLAEIKEIIDKALNIKVLIIGDGEGLQLIRNATNKFNLNKNVIMVGKISNTENVLKRIDVGIIPFTKNSFTETILPTKLFEYMANKKPVIAPNFGVFKEILTDGKDALLYSSYRELVEKIYELRNNKKKKEEITLNGYKTYLNHYDLMLYTKTYTNFILA